MTPADLSEPGWRLRVGRPEDCRLYVGGRTVKSEEVAGAVMRLGWISAAQIPWIAPEDRDYVAAEMMAFGLAFFEAAPFPVLNRPTPACLNGPAFRPDVWRAKAREAGFAVAGTAAPTTGQVRVVGRRCLGASSAATEAAALRLADAAGADLLEIRLGGTPDAPAFLGATAWPDLEAPGVAQAVCAIFAAPRTGADA